MRIRTIEYPSSTCSITSTALAAFLGCSLLIVFLATSPRKSPLISITWGQPAQQPRSLLSMSDHTHIVQLMKPAQVFGWVKKSGTLDLREWHTSYEQLKLRRFAEWIRGWRQCAQCKTADPPPTINLRCQVFVNHAYKFLYIRHQKTGSTSLKNYFTLCNSQRQGGPCMRQLSKRIPAPHLHRMWRDYLVFTVVRNPYARALSSYKYLLARMDSTHPCTSNLTWGGFCTDPMALGEKCRQRGCCDGTPDTFWTHTTGQDRCLLAAPDIPDPGVALRSPGGGSSGGRRVGWDPPPTAAPPAWAVDFIARTERLEEDLREVVKEIDRRRDPSLPALAAVVPDTGPARQNARPSCAYTATAEGKGDGGGAVEARGQVGAAAVAGGKEGTTVGTGAEGSSGGLEPQLWVGAGGRSFYGAVPREQYCRSEQYFQGVHSGCEVALRRFFHRDFELLYPGR